MPDQGRERVATRVVATILDLRYDEALRLVRKVREKDRFLHGSALTEAVRAQIEKEKK